MCLALKFTKEVKKYDNGNDVLFLGTKFLEGHNVQFDRKNNGIYFKPSSCLYTEVAHKFVFQYKEYLRKGDI